MNIIMKNITLLSKAAILSFALFTAQASDDTSNHKTAEQLAEEERCTVPAYAKAIGHEEMWKKHNGCPAGKETKKDE